jgi:hypothetical protein
MPGPPWVGRPEGLFSTISRASRHSTIASSSPAAAGKDGAGAGLAGTGGSGGMRTDWPGASRVAASARRPSTRIWPVRHSFSMTPWGSPSK